MYIGDIYRSVHPGAETDAATRAGSRAMFYEAIVGLITVFVVPALLESKKWGLRAIWAKHSPPRVLLCATWAASQLVSTFVMFTFSCVLKSCSKARLHLSNFLFQRLSFGACGHGVHCAERFLHDGEPLGSIRSCKPF